MLIKLITFFEIQKRRFGELRAQLTLQILPPLPRIFHHFHPNHLLVCLLACYAVDPDTMVRMLLLVVLLVQSWTAIWAYPDGAGSCIAGTAAVGGSHLDLLYNGLPRAFGVISGSLVDGDVAVLLGGIPLDSVSPTMVAAGQDHTIRVVGTLYDGLGKVRPPI